MDRLSEKSRLEVAVAASRLIYVMWGRFWPAGWRLQLHAGAASAAVLGRSISFPRDEVGAVSRVLRLGVGTRRSRCRRFAADLLDVGALLACRLSPAATCWRR